MSSSLLQKNSSYKKLTSTYKNISKSKASNLLLTDFNKFPFVNYNRKISLKEIKELNQVFIVLNSPTQINGATSIDGTLTTTGAIPAGSAQISTTGYIKGGTLFENYKGNSTQLNQIYSYKLKIATVTTGDFTVSAGGLKDDNLYVNNQSNYKPIGMVGYNVTNASSNGKNASYCLPYAMMFYEEENGTYKPRVRWQLRNINSSKDARVKISCKILYVAI